MQSTFFFQRFSQRPYWSVAESFFHSHFDSSVVWLEMDCILCSEVATAPRALPCHHAYCHLCILSVPTDVHGYSHCPACLTTFRQSLPPPNGKALLRTTHGDLEVQLFANECPKACRNFCQLILEGYYDGTALKDELNVRWRTDSFRIDGGDRSGDDDDCESIYGAHYMRMRSIQDWVGGSGTEARWECRRFLAQMAANSLSAGPQETVLILLLTHSLARLLPTAWTVYS